MTCRSDLTLEGVIRDPMIAAVLRADHVDPRGFETLLRTTQRRLSTARAGAPTEALMPPPTLPGYVGARSCERLCA